MEEMKEKIEEETDKTVVDDSQVTNDEDSFKDGFDACIKYLSFKLMDKEPRDKFIEELGKATKFGDVLELLTNTVK